MSFYSGIHPAAQPIADAFRERVPIRGMLMQIQALTLRAEGHAKQIDRSAWELPLEQFVAQIHRILDDMPPGFKRCELLIDEGGTFPTVLTFSEDFHRKWTIENRGR